MELVPENYYGEVSILCLTAHIKTNNLINNYLVASDVRADILAYNHVSIIILS